MITFIGMRSLRNVAMMLPLLALLLVGVAKREVAVCTGAPECSGTVHEALACPCDAHLAAAIAAQAVADVSVGPAACTCVDVIIGSSSHLLVPDRRVLPDPVCTVGQPGFADRVIAMSALMRRYMVALPRPPPDRAAMLEQLATVRLTI